MLETVQLLSQPEDSVLDKPVQPVACGFRLVNHGGKNIRRIAHSRSLCMTTTRHGMRKCVRVCCVLHWRQARAAPRVRNRSHRRERVATIVGRGTRTRIIWI